MSLLIAEAHAAAAPPAQGGSLPMMVMLGIFALVFYFMIYRPHIYRIFRGI